METILSNKNSTKSILRYLIVFLFTLSALNLQATDYYSNSSGNFNDASVWGESTNGSGTSPTGFFYKDGGSTHTFTINNDHIIVINDSINVAGLTVGTGGGTTTTLTFGEADDAPWWLIVRGGLTVAANAKINVSAFSATHNMQVEGTLTNGGSIDLRNNSNQVVNTILDGAFSITGIQPKFNNLTIRGGTITAEVTLDVDGTFTIESGATFNDFNMLHYVSGNWTQNGTRTGDGTIVFDASLVQSITTRATFNNVSIINGGIVSIGDNITVGGNFSIDESTKVTTASTNIFIGDFTINSGSTYEATAGSIYFDGTTAQNILLNEDSKFYNMYFRYGNAANKKTVVGDYTVTNFTRIEALNSVVAAGNITLRGGLDLQGDWDLTGTVTFKGGTIYNGSGDAAFSLGTADIIIDGYPNIQAGDAMTIDGDFTLNFGYFVINDNASLIGMGGDDTFLIKDNTTVYLRGDNNFPTGFSNYSLETLSTIRYDKNGPQTVRGDVTYGRLYLRYDTKTVDGKLDINDNLGLESSSTLELLNYDHTLGGHLTNSGSNSYVTSTGGSFTLDGPDNNQYIYAGAGYEFYNLNITNSSPTVLRYKRIYSDITLNGDFSITNGGGNEVSSIEFDIFDNEFLNTSGTSSDFLVGSNVRLLNNGADNFEKISDAFVMNLDVESKIYFNRNGAQNIPSITYGCVEFTGSGNKTALGNLNVDGEVVRRGGSPVLVDDGFSITVAKNWEMAIAYTNLTGSTTFDGGDQTISSSKFGNLIFGGTETKYIDGTIDVIGNVTINNGITVNSDNRYLYLGGNWNNSGTGVLSQVNGRTIFDGTNVDQTIVTNATNQFGDLYINKSGTPRTLIANSDIDVGRHFFFTQNKGDFDLNGNTLSVGGDWYLYTGCIFTHNNGKLVFNGGSEDQLIRNYNAATLYNDIEFKNSSVKRLYQNSFDIDGDVFINSATVNAGGYSLNVAGDWINSGSFQSSSVVKFDGADQSIGSSDFHDIQIAGSDTKTLAGNISCSGWLRIDQGATLDVSPTKYGITIEEHWYNNEGDGSGYFEPRGGTVTMIGGASYITTGGILAGKQFYNLTINNSSSDSRLNPYTDNPLKVLNNFTLNSEVSSRFYTFYNDVYIGGSLVNNGAYYYQNSNGTANKIVFDGTSGSYNIDFGDLSTIQDTIVIDGGANYNLTGDLTFNQGGNLRIANGTLDLNAQTLEMYTGDVIIQDDGVLSVSAGGVLKVVNGKTFFNNNGKFKLIGDENAPATLTSRTGTFEYTQTGALSEFHAAYYLISNTYDNGINIEEGSIDNTNNLSNGTFTSGTGTGAYLTTNDINLGAGITATNVAFNTGPSKNVQRTAGATGVLTFANATGTFAGEANENDPGDLIAWTNDGRITWVGADGGDWNIGANWSSGNVPTSSDDVYLDNSSVLSAYTINIKTAHAVANKVEVQGSAGVNLVLDGYELAINDILTIAAGNSLIQTTNLDTIHVGGNFSNSGNYIPGIVGVMHFNPIGGFRTINTNDSFYDVVVDCDTITTSVVLGSNVTIINDLSIINGTLSASNRNIGIDGNWLVEGGYFDAGTGTVNFTKTTGGNQTIAGGVFNNFTTQNAAVKEITKNIEVQRNFDIKVGSSVDGGENFIYIGGRFDNREGKNGFTQSGSGTTVFNGLGTCYLQNSAKDSTIFNHLIFQGNGNKHIYDTVIVKGNFINQLGSNTYLYENAYIIGEGADNNMFMTGGYLYLRGENNFPREFENISLTGGDVYYSYDSNQVIYPTTYYNLRLGAIYPNNIDSKNTKTLSGDVIVTNRVTVVDTATTFNVNSHTITIGEYLDFYREFTPQIEWGTGSVIFNGGNTSIDRYIHNFYNLTKSGTGSLTMYDTIQVDGDLTLESNTRLNMQSFKVTCESAGKTLTMEDGTILYTYVLAENNPGMPTGFDNYSLNSSSRVEYRGVGKQTIYTNGGTIDYGNVWINTSTTDTLSLDGDLTVSGEFRMLNSNPVLVDSTFNMTLSGSIIDLRKYTPTNTITINGATQSIYNGQGNDTLKFNNLILDGALGEKTFNETITSVRGDLTVGANDTMYVVYDFEFLGNTFTNNGYFRHIRNIAYFNGADQTINPGANNDFYAMVFKNGATKTIVGNGFDVYNGIFRIEDTTEVDFGSLTHNIASVDIEFEDVTVDSLHVEDATIIFDRTSGTQYLPKLDIESVEFSGGGWKVLNDTLRTENLTIKGGANFRPGDVSPDAFPIYIFGNWVNEGNFASYEGTVYFESDDENPKSITSGGDMFYNVMFNQDSIKARTYSLVDDAIFSEELTIGYGATLKLNGKNLQLGNNDTGEPLGEQHIIQDGGILELDAGANLLIDCYDDTASVVVESGGLLSLIGTSGNPATVTRASSRYAYDITIESGATIRAKYYHFHHIADSGLWVKNGAIIDPMYNFSYGIWSDIYTGTTHGKQRYLYIDTDISGLKALGDIVDVTFNHGGTPRLGTHYNVKYGDNASGSLSFTGTTSGLLGGELYEDEGNGISVDPGNITWPPVTTILWTGAVNTDWFNASNWSPAQVPDITNDAVIPVKTNNPIINTSDTAKCQSLNITDGVLVIDAGILDVYTDVTLGSGAILGVGDANSSIIVGRDWNSAVDANFIPGGDTVKFISTTTTAFITPRNVVFDNVVFDGTSTFFIEGNSIDVNGEFKIVSGTVYPNSTAYIYKLGGDFNNVGGTFSTETRGVVMFDGADQDITNGTFSQVDVAGTGTKTIIGNLSCTYYNYSFNYKALEVNSILLANAGSTMDIDGNVYIASGATFNDGGEDHYFAGRYWESEGAYVGNGTIIFDGGSQYLRASTFNNLQLNNQSGTANNWKYLEDDVQITGDLIVNCYGFQCYTYKVSNTDGSGTFSMPSMDYPYNRIYLRGANNYPSGFSSYAADYQSYQIYDGAIDQTVYGKSSGSDPIVEYGYLYLNSATIKTLGGDIDVSGRIYFFNGDVTLDVSTNNYKINLAGNWYNQYTGTFICRQGDVIMDGSNTWPGTNQWIYLGTSGVNDFYKLTINSTSDYMRIYNTDITINSNLSVLAGTLYLYNGFTTTIKGDLNVTNSGLIYPSGTYKLAKASGSSNIQLNGSVLNNFIIDAGATYNLLDDFALNGTFNLLSGTFNGNGKSVKIGNYYDVANISGTYIVGPGGNLKISSQTSFNVLSGGVVEVVGTEGDAASVSNQGSNGRYNFSVESGASIKAENYLFEYMTSSGIYLKDGSIIDNTNHFSNGTFSNPQTGGTCLRIENSQSFNIDSIENVIFPMNPGSGTTNVTKTSNTIGALTFYNSTGSLSGEYYDNDPGSLIAWTGPVTLTWTGTIDEDWHDKRNWSADIGPQKIPEITDDVIVPQSLNPPKILTDSAQAKNVTIENGAFLTINTPSGDDDKALIIKGNFTNEGTFTMTSLDDTLVVSGNWEKKNAAIFNPGLGTVELFIESGVKSLLSGDAAFNNLVINAVGTLEMNSDLYIGSDLNITNGTLDVSGNNFSIFISGSLSNAGTIDAQAGSIIFNGTTAGTETVNIGASSFYNLEVNAGASTTYQLLNDITVNGDLVMLGGTLDIKANSLNFGDGVGLDVFSIENSIFNMDANSFLKMNDNASVIVNTGGEFKAIGTDDDNIANITKAGTENYSFTVASGGKLYAKYYEFSYLDAIGVWFKAGALIDGVNNLSNGTFSNGADGGRYLLFENALPVSFEISDVIFNSGASYNAERTAGANPVEFIDAFGLRGSYYFEKDEEASPEPESGLIQWTYTDPVAEWVGGVVGFEVDWDTPNNWKDGGVPTDLTVVFIPDVTYNPVISTNNFNEVKNITIYSGGHLTIGNDQDFTISNNLSGEGTLEVATSSNTTIEVGDNWDNLGVFINGGNSTVKFVKASGTIDINPGTNAFHNLEFNSTGSAVFKTSAGFDINGDLNIAANTTFQVTSAAHNINVGGDFTNNGTFINGGSDFVFDGSGDQELSGSASHTFKNLLFSGSAGNKIISNDITVENDLTIASNNTVLGSSSTIDLYGDWIGSGIFTPETSHVKFQGNSLQNLSSPTTESFYNLTLNNSVSGIAIKLATSIDVSGALTMSDGIMETSHSSIINMLATSSVIGATSASFVDGPMTKTGDSDFVFPVGKGSVFAQLGIDTVLTLSKFKLEYFDGGPSNRNNLVEPLNDVSSVEKWSLSRISGSSKPHIKLYWESDIRSGTEKEVDVVVAQYDGSNWVSFGGNPATDNGNGTGHVLSNDSISIFNDLTIGFEYPTATWEGDVSSAWETPGNWDIGTVPNTETNVVIANTSATTNVYPTIDATSASTYNIIIKSGAILTLDNHKDLNVEGIFTIDASGTLVINDASESDVYVNKTWVNNGTFTPGTSSTVYYAKTDVQDINLGNCHNLVVSGSGIKTLQNSIDITGDLTVQSTLNANGNYIKVAGNWLNTGIFTPGSGTVEFNGTTAQTITKGSNGETFFNVVMNNSFATSPQIVLGGKVTLAKSLTLTDGVVLTNSSSKLVFQAGATSNSGSANSFVIGPIQKYGTSDFVFPTGRASKFARVGLTELTGNGIFTAEYFNTAGSDLSNLLAPLVSISVNEHWIVSRSDDNYSAKVTLYYEDSAFSKVKDPATILIAHYDGSNWISEGNSAFSPAALAGSVTSEIFTGFSPITYGSSTVDNPLPVELTDFTAMVQEDKVKLDWQTASEVNSSHYVVERSTDAINFNSIGIKESIGNSSTFTNYSFYDENPLSGELYYRLVQMDFDGERHVYPMVSVYFSKYEEGFENITSVLYPNPGSISDIMVGISIQKATKFTVNILDLMGKRVFGTTVELEDNQDYYQFKLGDFVSLPEGLYMMSIRKGDALEQLKFIVE